MVEANLQG